MAPPAFCYPKHLFCLSHHKTHGTMPMTMHALKDAFRGPQTSSSLWHSLLDVN